MKRHFSLFQSHLNFAHKLWSQVVDSQCVVIDATCGNGHDSAYLALLNPLKLFCLDILKEAIDATKDRLEGYDGAVEYLRGCHSTLPEVEADLVVYNLGYLPGGDKSLTTQVETTLTSVNQALTRVKPGGVISITCYPGHPEGALEEKALWEWCQTLDPAVWCCSTHQFINRKQSPSLLLIQRNGEVPQM